MLLLTQMAATASKPYHHGDLQQTLLRVIEDLIREKGIEGISLRECARRAAVSWSAPLHHFGDKPGMLTAFAIEGFAKLSDLMEKKKKEEDVPAYRAAAVGEGYLEFALQYPEHFKVMFRTELLKTSSAAYLTASRSAFNILEDSFREVDVAFGRPNDPTLQDRCLLAWSTVHGYASLCLEGAIEFPVPDANTKARQLERGRTLIRLLGPALFNFEESNPSHNPVTCHSATPVSLEEAKA